MIDIPKLGPGDLLNELVAEKVMNWTAYRYEKEGSGCRVGVPLRSLKPAP